MKKTISSLIFVLLIGAAGYLAYTQQQTPPVFAPYSNEKLQDRVVTLDPASYKVITERISSVEKTIATFNEKTSNNDKVNHYFALAGDEQALGRYKDAKKSLENALGVRKDAHILHAYAFLLYQMGAGEDTFIYLDEAIRQAPDVPNFWQTKIQISRELYKGNLKKIEDVYLDGLRKTKEDIDLLTLYASYLAEIGKKDESIRYWQKAIEKNPSAQSIYESEIKNLQ